MIVLHQHMDLFGSSTTIFKHCNVTPEIALAIFECIKMKGACPDSSWPQLKIDCIRAASERLGKIDYVETALKGFDIHGGDDSNPSINKRHAGADDRKRSA